MLDFWKVSTKSDKKNPDIFEIAPKFIINLRTKDLMIRGGDFYAVWNPETNLWSTDEQTVIDIIDNELRETANRIESFGKTVSKVAYMNDPDTGSIDRWHKYCQKQMRDCFHMLDEKIIFSNTKMKKNDYASKKLPYALEEGDISAYDQMMSTLYDPDERRKLEWAIGAIVCGDSKHIQKFEVLYGSHGTGKSTVLDIIQDLFAGYWNVFNAKELGNANSAFAMESFKTNPLVSIQHDGDLSRIEDNTKLNSIISHESLPLNAKYEKIYTSQFKSFLFMGTNTPVKITEAKSGIIRRLIDVYPSGRKLPYKKYTELKAQIRFELGAIAYHCLMVYKEMGEDYYEAYVPSKMISATNDFYDFITYKYDELIDKEYITQTEAWGLYKEYCEFAHAKLLSYQRMGVELRNYYKEFFDRKRIDGKNLRNVYTGFISDKFASSENTEKVQNEDSWLKFECEESIFDAIFKDQPAQYCKEDGSPKAKWENVKTKLLDIDTRKLHWMKLPQQYIVMDFDKKDLEGKKSLKENLKAASMWKPTYAELSKSGVAIHLVYKYEGDVSKLNFLFDEDIEIKTFSGNSSLRRLLSKCNDIDIATLKEGSLPLKGEARVINWEGIKNEKIIRSMILNNLEKKYHGDTSSSIDFIKKVLDDAYDAKFPYDVSDLEDAVRKFALSSTNQKDKCMKVYAQMKFKSEVSDEVPLISAEEESNSEECKLVHYDVEVYKNFFGIVWMYDDSDKGVWMINPSPEEVAEWIKAHEGCLIGFNNRQYDNHIIWARAFQARSNMGLYNLSQQIINERRGFIREAYDISYTDVYDFCTEKKSLKKWEVALGIHHQEMGIPWDEPVPDDMINTVMEYCENDVRATKAVFHARYGDFMARKIQVALVKQLHGDDIKVSVNDTTNTLSKRIIFGKNRTPQDSFNYRNLALPVGPEQYEEYRKKFGPDYKFRVFDDFGLPLYRDYVPGEVLPKGYSILPFFPEYEFGWSNEAPWYNEEVTNRVGFHKSLYLGEEIGEGGRVYSVPGYYEWILDLDVSSMHPNSVKQEMLFGAVNTPIFNGILEARVAVKHRDFEKARGMLGGALTPFLSEEYAGDLAQALKIVINSIYGLTKAGFVNEFRDPRNEDNIVAKRGALFMTLLKREVERKGYLVAHIKTDSIKIPDADDYIKDFVIKFGREFGYEFEVEGIFTKFCLLNDAAYVALEDNGKWTTKAAQFNKDTSPYVYKTLFSHDPIEFSDMCETKSVSKGALYLDMNEDLEDVTQYEKLLEKTIKKGGSQEDIDNLKGLIASGHNYQFIGRVGNFCPVKPGSGGGVLYRIENGKTYAATGTTGYRWLESEYVRKYGGVDLIDISFYNNQVNSAVESMKEYLDPAGIELDWFLSSAVPEKKLKNNFMNIPEGSDEEIPW